MDEGFVSGEAEYIWTRKYWYEPINLEHFIDLVRRAVEVRARDHGDVELIHFEDDGAYIHLSYAITTYETNLRLAFRRIRLVSSTLEETAAAASAEAGKRLAEIASRVSGWGTKSLDILSMQSRRLPRTTSVGAPLRNSLRDSLIRSRVSP